MHSQAVALDWPDKTQGYTHILVVLADTPALKAYLHSELHKADWVGAVGPHCSGPPLVFDIPLAPIAVAEPDSKIHHFVIFKLPELPDAYMPNMLATVSQFNELPGIQAAFMAAGAPGMNLAQTLEALAWPDKTAGFTHCLLVIADDIPSLKAYLHSELHLKAWIGHMQPAKSQGPPIVFDSPLVMAL